MNVLHMFYYLYCPVKHEVNYKYSSTPWGKTSSTLQVPLMFYHTCPPLVNSSSLNSKTYIAALVYLCFTRFYYTVQSADYTILYQTTPHTNTQILVSNNKYITSKEKKVHKNWDDSLISKQIICQKVLYSSSFLIIVANLHYC